MTAVFVSERATMNLVVLPDVELVMVKSEACTTTTPANAIIATSVERMYGIFMLLLLGWHYYSKNAGL